MYEGKVKGELGRRELEAARLGFNQLLRCKRFSPQFIESFAEDLFATATLEYSRKLAEGERIENPAGWLITCAWRRTQSHLEADGRRPRVVSVEKSGPLGDESDHGPADALLDKDRFRKVHEAVEQLSVDQRRVLALSYFEGFTVREAGRRLRWHPSKAQRAHEGAKRRLHQLLDVRSADELEIEIGLAAYVSLAANPSAGRLLERAAQKSADGLASFKQQIADGAAQLKQHATATYYRAVDPTPLAAARPGTAAGVVAACIALGGGATYCVEQGVSPVGAARGLIASTGEPEAPPPSEPPATPVYTPVEPPPSEEPPAPEPAPAPVQPAPEPNPEPVPPPPPEEHFEPVAGEEVAETYEASEEPAPVESPQPEPAPAAPGPQFGGPGGP